MEVKDLTLDSPQGQDLGEIASPFEMDVEVPG